MEITIHELRNCLDIAADLSERYDAYVGPGASPRKSRDDFLQVVKDYVGHDIEIYELDDPLEHETIYGFYVAEADGYSVLLRTGLPEDDIRFVLCKELFHAMIDSKYPEYRSEDTCNHLDEVAVAFPVRESKPGAAVRSEVLAEIGAMEFLFPYAARQAELAAAGATPVDHAQVADKYGLPQYLVEIYLQPSYMTELGAMLPKAMDG